jgi:hypothetical protein
MALNQNQLLDEYNALKQKIDDYTDPRPGWRKQLTALNQLVTALSDDSTVPKPRRRLRVLSTEELVECKVPDCTEVGVCGDRCKRHHNRWLKSEEVKAEPGAIKCKRCPAIAGQWVKNAAGLSMHNHTWHPEANGVSA